MAISMLKIRRPLGRLIFNMGIAIPGKTVFLIETAPWSSYVKMASSHVMQGEHVYEDIRYMARIPPAALDAVKTMTFRDDDVLLVTYPKAGESVLYIVFNSSAHISVTSYKHHCLTNHHQLNLFTSLFRPTTK